MLGAILALVSAATFGLNNASIRRGVMSGTVVQALSITVPMGVPVFFLLALATGNLGLITGFSTQSVLLLMGTGVTHFIVGRYSNYRALRAMGANLVTPIQTCSLVFALGIAVAFLDEVITPLRLAGILLVLLGPIIMLQGQRAKKPPPREDGFQPNYLEGFIFAALSAVGWGISPILIRAALADMEIGASLLGGLIAYGTAACLVGLYFAKPKNFRHALSTNRTAVKWFVLSGVFVSISQIFRFAALVIAPVAVVAPIQQTTIVFRTAFGWFINRDAEDFSLSVIAGIAVALVGALSLTLSTEFVIGIFEMSPAMSEILRWQWP